MSFATSYASVLSPFVRQFKEASNDTARKAVITLAVDAVTKAKAVLEDAEELPKELRTVCVPHFFMISRCLEDAPGYQTLLERKCGEG